MAIWFRFIAKLTEWGLRMEIQVVASVRLCWVLWLPRGAYFMPFSEDIGPLNSQSWTDVAPTVKRLRSTLLRREWSLGRL